jgi:pyruvate,water dikinase
MSEAEGPDVVWLGDVGSSDVASVGGKNASLGEMITSLAGAGIRVPDGFATTADAYWRFIDDNQLRARITGQIERLHSGAALADVGRTIREMVLEAQGWTRLGPSRSPARPRYRPCRR